MNFYQRIFGKKSTPAVSTQEMSDAQTQEDNSFNFYKQLFVENTPPSSMDSAKKKVSKLNEFLATDYSTIGFSDGYELHNKELCDHKKNIIMAEFRQLVDEAIDGHRQDLFQLRNQLIETNGLNDGLTQQLELRIAEIRGLITKLEQEKQLSVEYEGLVIKSIYQYSEGFLRGCTDWHQAKLFAKSTGLF